MRAFILVLTCTLRPRIVLHILCRVDSALLEDDMSVKARISKVLVAFRLSKKLYGDVLVLWQTWVLYTYVNS